MSFTRLRLQTRPWSSPMAKPAPPAARTPTHALPVPNETAYAVIAPITRLPSRPRLMRPLRSVMHSPRLTKRNGVLTRSAPPSTAIGTTHQPMEASAMVAVPLGSPPKNAEAAVERFARQHRDEDHALQHQHRGVGQAEAALQQAAAGIDAAEQDRDRDHRERIMPGEERHQDAGEAVAGSEIGVGA